MKRGGQMMASDDRLRAQLVRLLDWEEAHVGFDKALADVPHAKQGTVAAGFEHSLWQLLEHLRLAQKDLLDFCVNREYVHSMKWPDDYWPKKPAPPDAKAWDASVSDFKSDRSNLKQMIENDKIDLFALVPKG